MTVLTGRSRSIDVSNDSTSATRWGAGAHQSPLSTPAHRQGRSLVRRRGAVRPAVADRAVRGSGSCGRWWTAVCVAFGFRRADVAAELGEAVTDGSAGGSGVFRAEVVVGGVFELVEELGPPAAGSTFDAVRPWIYTTRWDRTCRGAGEVYCLAVSEVS